jgi:hypothetical protein
MMTKHLPRPSTKNAATCPRKYPSILILTPAQKQQVLDDPTLLTKNIIPDHIENYKWD